MADEKKTVSAGDEARLRQIVREELAALLREQLPAVVREQLAHFAAHPGAGAHPGAAAAAGGAAIAAPPNTTGRLNHRTMALIAAAVAAALGSQARVRNITFLNQNTISGWVEAGRINIQSSHTLRRSL